MKEYDIIDMSYAKQDAFDAGKNAGFFAGCCAGFLLGFMVGIGLWALS